MLSAIVDKNSKQLNKKRKPQLITSSKADVEKRLRFRIKAHNNKAIAVERMLLEAGRAEELLDTIMKPVTTR